MRLGSGLGSARLDEEYVHVRPNGEDDQRVALVRHAEDRAPVVGARGVEVLVEELPRDAHLVWVRVKVRARARVRARVRVRVQTLPLTLPLPLTVGRGGGAEAELDDGGQRVELQQLRGDERLGQQLEALGEKLRGQLALDRVVALEAAAVEPAGLLSG